MATNIGIVRKISGIVVAVDANGNQRNLSAGDSIMLGEVIKAVGETSHATISMDNAKEIIVNATNPISIDQSVVKTESFDSESTTLANLSDLQKAILAGGDLTQLEETAAGGATGGGNATGTAQLNEAYFAEGGHESNVNADGRDLNANTATFAIGINPIGTAANDFILDEANGPTPPIVTPPSTIEIPSSAYANQILAAKTMKINNTPTDTGDDYFTALQNAIDGISSPNNSTYDVSNTNLVASSIKQFITGATNMEIKTKTVNGTTFNKVNIDFDTSKFDYQDGWFISKDKSVIIGQDGAKPLVVVSDTNTSYDNNPNVTVVKVSQGQKPSIFGSDTKDSITVDGATVNSISTGTGADNIDIKNGAVVEKTVSGGDGDDNINVSNNSTVQSNIYGGDGKDNINISNNSKVEKNIVAGDGNDNVNVSDNSEVKENISAGDGDDNVKISSNSTIQGSIYGGSGNDDINVDQAKVQKNVIGQDGDDKISVTNGGRVEESIISDTTTHDVARFTPEKDPGAGNDTVIIDGAGSYVKQIGTGNGNDDITIKNGGHAAHIQADGGDDTILVSGAGSKADVINGREGNDNITVQDGATAGDIVGRWGNDNITIKGKDTTVTGKVQGNEDDDTINVLDGATVNGAVTGGAGEKRDGTGKTNEVYTDNDTLNIKNATVKGNVEGGGWNGVDKINIENSTIGGSVVGSKGETSDAKANDTINISKSNIAGHVMGNEGDDTINITNNSNIAGIVDGGTGNDTININSGSKVQKNAQGGMGDDVIRVSGDGTSVGEHSTNKIGLSGQFGNDEFIVEDKARIFGEINSGGITDNNKVTITGGSKVDSVNLNLGGGNSSLNIENSDVGDIYAQDAKGAGAINMTIGGNTIKAHMELNRANGNTIVIEETSGDSIDLSNVSNYKVGLNSATNEIDGITTIDLNHGTSNVKLNIDPKDILDLNPQQKSISGGSTTDKNDLLTIKGDSNDAVKLKGDGWKEVSNDNDNDYRTFEGNDGKGETVYLKIENDIQIDM